jgi:hypothetical protein
VARLLHEALAANLPLRATRKELEDATEIVRLMLQQMNECQM